MDELFQRGFNNIKDARFIREQVIRASLESERWNIAIHQSYQIVELLVKGMICLTGNKPKHDHKIEILLDQLSNILKKTPGELIAAPLAVVSNNGYYGLWTTQNETFLLKYVSGNFTQLGSGFSIDIKADKLLYMRLSVENSTITIYADGKILYTQTDSSLIGPFQMKWELTQTPTLYQINKLKEIGGKLKDKREKSFYSEKIFTEENANDAIALMNEANELLSYYLVEPVI